MNNPAIQTPGPDPHVPVPARTGDHPEQGPRPEMPPASPQPEIPPKPSHDVPQPDRERA